MISFFQLWDFFLSFAEFREQSVKRKDRVKMTTMIITMRRMKMSKFLLRTYHWDFLLNHSPRHTFPTQESANLARLMLIFNPIRKGDVFFFKPESCIEKLKRRKFCEKIYYSPLLILPALRSPVTATKWFIADFFTLNASYPSRKAAPLMGLKLPLETKCEFCTTYIFIILLTLVSISFQHLIRVGFFLVFVFISFSVLQIPPGFWTHIELIYFVKIPCVLFHGFCFFVSCSFSQIQSFISFDFSPRERGKEYLSLGLFSPALSHMSSELIKEIWYNF